MPKSMHFIYYGKDQFLDCSTGWFLKVLSSAFFHCAKRDFIPTTESSYSTTKRGILYTNLLKGLLEEFCTEYEGDPEVEPGTRIYRVYISDKDYQWDREYSKHNYWSRDMHMNLHKVVPQLNELNDTPKANSEFMERYFRTVMEPLSI